MTDRLEVPPLFLGEVPQDFYDEALRRYALPRAGRLGRFVSRLLFRDAAKIDITNDMFVRALYRQTIAESELEEARQSRRKDMYDEVTGLLNSRYLKEAGNELLQTLDDRRYSKVIAAALDIVDFGKDINNIYGHLHGNRVLATDIAPFLTGAFRPQDIVGRWGGDEFVALVHITDPTVDPQEFVDEISRRLDDIPFDRKDQPKQIRYRVAVCEAGMDMDAVMDAIDIKGPGQKLAVYSRVNPSYLAA